MSTPTPPVLAYASPGPARPPSDGHFTRALGLLPAIAVNMTQMCGIGPFVTIPLMIATMGGPQAIFGWLLGAVLVMADGLVWAELGAAMPGAGGTYLYLREAFQYRTGRLMPFLFIWTIMIATPLTMASGVIGIVQYLGFYFPNLRPWAIHAISIGTVAFVVFALYRRIGAIGKLANALFAVMLLTVGAMIVASFTHFHASLAFAFPKGAFGRGGAFWTGLGGGLIYAIYDYGGYQTTAYMGDELRDPGRVIPRSIIWSIVGMMLIYLLMNIGIMGVLPWQTLAQSTAIGADVVQSAWGRPAARVLAALIIITGFASIFTGLLGASRVPYNAARDKLFFSAFGRLHPRLNFPHVALLVMGLASAAATFLPLDDVIKMLTAATILVQFVAQVIAITVLRRRQPALRRPYRMFLYPLPSLLALAGWIYLYIASGKWMILLSLGWLGLGVIAFLIWAAFEKTWPFGPREIREQFLVDQPSTPERGFEGIMPSSPPA
jgi:amino acid transporter